MMILLLAMGQSSAAETRGHIVGGIVLDLPLSYTRAFQIVPPVLLLRIWMLVLFRVAKAAPRLENLAWEEMDPP